MNDSRLSLFLWSIGLVLCGVVLLLFNFDLLSNYEPLAQYIVGGLLGAAAISFFIGYLYRRQNWWRLIPGWTLLALAAMVILSTVSFIDPILIASLLFLGLALAFTNVYLVRRVEHWWALIPGGFMLVLGAVIALTVAVERMETLGALLFAGMGLVFVFVYVLGGNQHRWWALIPGSVLMLFGLFVFSIDSGVEGTILRWWPVILILLGILLGWQSFSRRLPPEKMAVSVAPRAPAPEVGSESTGPSQTASAQGMLGEYSGPAPGASVDVLPDYDEDRK